MSDITVLVLDDHEVVRRGICEIIERADGLTVAAEASNVAEAIRRINAVRPQVVLTDLRLPDGTGLDVAQHVSANFPETFIVVLTSYDDDDARAAVLAAGAHAFVPKTARGPEIVEAVKNAIAGRTQRSLTEKHDDDATAGLTPMERRVLDLVGVGKPNREIADELGIAEKTVKNHVTSVLAKMGLQRRTQVVAWATARRASSFRG